MRRFLEINGVQVATHVGITVARGRTVPNQTGLPRAFEILSNWQLVCVIPVPERRDLSASLTVLLFNKINKHKNDYLNLRNSREERRGAYIHLLFVGEEKSGIGWETLMVWELKRGYGEQKGKRSCGDGIP